jgi:hypothetical protein
MATYEMLWDCSSCGTNKLLGKTHRRCPHCGAPQVPSSRYFPAPGEEVEAANHVYVGVDWLCAACTTPNSRAASFCVSCGNGRAGNATTALVPDARPGAQRVTAAVGAARSAPAPVPALATGRSRLPLVAAAVMLALLAACLVTVFWQKDVQVRVEQHDWSRDIDVERLDPRSDSSWCDAMPGDAYSVSRSREVRSHRQIPDGQSCHTVNRDNGDGTYSTRNECTTRYRSEPIYDTKCRYTVDRWHVLRTAHNGGVGLSPPRSWPSFSLGRTGSCRGCEREGGRREVLGLDLRATKDASKTWRCDVDDARWQRLRDGDVRTFRVRVVTGGAVCSTLVP